MALLDAAIRVYGIEQGESWFPQIRDLSVAISLPQSILVNNTFIKILRPHKRGVKDQFGTGLAGPMGNTIAYREFVQFNGDLQIALFNNSGKGKPLPLPQLASQIHYLGKRGGFMQFRGFDEVDELSEEYVVLTSEIAEQFQLDGTMQLLDDCGPKMTFAHADIFSDKRLGVNQPNGRILRPIILPYRMVRSSRGYTLYERLADAG